MPRDRYDDPETDGLFVQVNCRRDNDDGLGSPGHVQISTHDGQPFGRVVELIGTAGQLIGALLSAAKCAEQPSRDLEWLVGEWAWKVQTYNQELTGTYVTLTPETNKALIKTLHRFGNLAWPPVEQVTGALDGVTIPRAGEQSPPGSLPPPGATGWPTDRQVPPAPRES